MGAQSALACPHFAPPGALECFSGKMAPKAMKKSMKGAAKVLSKSGLAEEIASATELKKKDVTSVLDSLASVATTQVKKAGKVTIPGLCMIKTRMKPATKAGKREVFGKVV